MLLCVERIRVGGRVPRRKPKSYEEDDSIDEDGLDRDGVDLECTVMTRRTKASPRERALLRMFAKWFAENDEELIRGMKSP